MTTQVLFIQGGGEGTHDEWDNKLVDSLRRELGPGYDIRYPRMPNEADPSYPAWKAALLEEMAGLAEGAVVVGHSIGGTILINALAEAPPKRKLAGIFLIAAPFVGPADGRATTSCQRPISARGCRRRRPSTSIMGARTRPRRLRMSIFTRRRYRARTCTSSPAAITSSTMI
jgi:predicted alpha/beta hydrolase family esterase